MSDLYDSLEDECDENKCSSDSLDQYKTTTEGSDRRISDNALVDNHSFYSCRNVSEEGINIPNSQFSKTPPENGEKTCFLPKIENDPDEKDLETIRSFIVDSQILSQQGLQLNRDGSFTKSPRLDVEELPFITREYRNLQFQKKKLYKTHNKRLPLTKVPKKDMFSFSKRPTSGISMNQIINARMKKESSEEILTSRGSSYSNRSQSKAHKEFESNDNLTDSMKERLLQSQRENPKKSFKTARNVKKTKREFNLKHNCEASRQNKFCQQNKTNVDIGQKKTCLSNERLEKKHFSVVTSQKKPKNTDSKIFKPQSDILLNSVRPKLNYSERQLLKSGYNPLHLRQWNRKMISDTTRSNFGDSTVEELPEFSNLALSIENLNGNDNEDEEIFYQQLIERDKHMKLQSQLSTRSVYPLEVGKLRTAREVNFCKDQKETREVRKNNPSSKNVSKSMSIDLPSEVDYSVNSLKKLTHYCSVDTSPNISKVELALKAKTYGCLVNARNIFRLKAQSERKSSPSESTNTNNNEKINSAKKIIDFPQDGALQSRCSLLPQNKYSCVKGESPQSRNIFPKVTKSLSRTKPFKGFEENKEEFVLPQVKTSQVRNGETPREILQQMKFCFESPKG